jgi:hypothetical protein
MPQRFSRSLCVLVSLPAVLAAQAGSQKAALVSAEQKPVLKVATNGFPSGQDTPEGVAVDLASAFISKDPKLFRSICIPPFGAGKNRKAYEDFLAGTETSLTGEAGKSAPSPDGPKSISKLFAARHLSLNGPASYGNAVYDFQDVMFVDVEVSLHNGNRTLSRTLVIKQADGKWYVHPAPDTCPLLSAGLNTESKSTIDFTEAYAVQKP